MQEKTIQFPLRLAELYVLALPFQRLTEKVLKQEHRREFRTGHLFPIKFGRSALPVSNTSNFKRRAQLVSTPPPQLRQKF